MKNIKSIIHANGVDIRISSSTDADYISLTDIAKYRSDEPAAVIQNWLRNRNTIEYLGLWESLNNPNFKPLEFEGFNVEQVSCKEMFYNCHLAISITSFS